MLGVPMSKAASFHEVACEVGRCYEPARAVLLLDKIDAVAPTPLRIFDLFPNLPSTYRLRRPTEHGFLTLFTTSVPLRLITNDIGELILAWSNYELGVDHTPMSYLVLNVD